MTPGIIIIGGCIIIILLILLVLLIKNNNKLKISKLKIQNINELMQTIIDADDSLICLKDENLRYMFVNRAVEAFFKRSADKVIGCDDYALTNNRIAQKIRRTDSAVLSEKTLVVNEEEWDGQIYKITKFPVKMLNGKLGVGAFIRDVTEERNSLKKLEKVLQRYKILMDVFDRSFQSVQEHLDYVLHRSLKLAESQYGYIYLYDEEKREFTLNSWTNGVMDECKIVEKQTVYQLEKTGIWGEVVRQRKPIVVNDFEQPNPLKKGYPKGHVQLKKYMSVPIIIDDHIVAVVGMGNKRTDYDQNDVYEITLLMNNAWQAIKRREAQEKLIYERNRYLQTLVSIGDGVMVVNREGRIEMLNTVAQDLTGWKLADAIDKHYKEIFFIAHEQKGIEIEDPIEKVFETGRTQELGNNIMLTSKNGTRYDLEDSAAPIKDDMGTIVGVILVFRDVTEKKEQRKKIEYLSYHDSLTGLYNRRFFEEEMHRLDAERDLPISIIMGDVNKLKLTNDIFGHSFGDKLLQKVAEVLKNVCRADDIIARWGGDEFVILLPKTNMDEAERIVTRIKNEFANEQIKAIKGSISMGVGIKQNMVEDITQTLKDAEEKMYFMKMLERDEVQNSTIDEIIKTLHQSGVGEKEHSIRVCELCSKLGEKLKLSEVDISKLKQAAYLHDIGKIVLNISLLKKSDYFNSQEWDEIKKHSIIGYRILNSFDHTVDLAEPVLAHHEQWDGKGYPKGLQGEEIPILARIISIVETYDRITHSSANTASKSSTEAIQIIRENAGKQFDPKIAEIFAQMIEPKH